MVELPSMPSRGMIVAQNVSHLRIKLRPRHLIQEHVDFLAVGDVSADELRE